MKIVELIADPKNWLKGIIAQNAEGEYANALSGEAVKFCVYGALLRRLKDEDLYREDGIVSYVTGLAIDYNNHPATTHEEILEVARRWDDVVDEVKAGRRWKLNVPGIKNPESPYNLTPQEEMRV